MALRDAVGLERVIVDTYQAVSGTGADAIAEFEGQIRAHVAGEPKHASVYPHPIAFNALPAGRRLPRQRLHEGGVEGRHARAARSSTCPSCASRRRPSACRSSSPTPRRSTSRPATRSRRSEPASCSPRSPASSSRTIPRHRRTRSRPTRPAPTRSTSAGSGPTSRSPTAAASRSGSSATTSARARPRTPSRSPRRSSRAAGSAPPTARGAAAVPRPGRREPWRRGDRRVGVTHDERQAALDEVAAQVRACTRCRLHETRTHAVPGEGSADTEVVFVGEGPGFHEDRLGPAVRRTRRRPARRSSSARSAGGARRSSSRTS